MLNYWRIISSELMIGVRVNVVRPVVCVCVCVRGGGYDCVVHEEDLNEESESEVFKVTPNTQHIVEVASVKDFIIADVENVVYQHMMVGWLGFMVYQPL